MITSPSTIQSQVKESKAWQALLILILVLGFAIRLYDLTDLPLDFHPTRQLFSALKARSMYYETLPDAPEWQKTVAMTQRQALIEPPVMETLVVWNYRLFGEKLWLARIYSSSFWVVGGLFVYSLGKAFSSKRGALIALLFYLFLPYGVIASRSFQPDPLMVCLLMGALWALYTWDTQRTWSWAVAAGFLTGAAIFVKNVAVFPLLGAALALIVRNKLKETIKDGQVWLIAALTILPTAIFTLYGVYGSGELASQFSLRFFPNMWLEPAFYLRWIGMLDYVVDKAFVFFALVGIIISRPHVSAYLWGMLGGYFVYGMLFSYYTTSHDYYQLMFIPIVALGLGQVADTLYEWLDTLQPVKLPKALLTSLLIFAVAINLWDVVVQLKRTDYRSDVTYWENIGDLLGHTETAIGISENYGSSLAYWGWQDMTGWIGTDDLNLRELAGIEVDLKQLFEENIVGKRFFVVTSLNQFDAQPQIKALLYDNYAIYAETSAYVIFDLAQPLTAH